MRRHFTFLAVVISLALLAGACSDDATRERDYVREASAIETELVSDVSSRVADQPRDPEVTLRMLEDYRSRFAALEPPSQWEDEHEQVLASLTDLQVALTSLRDSMAEKNAVGVRTALVLANDASDELTEALNVMREESRE